MIFQKLYEKFKVKKEIREYERQGYFSAAGNTAKEAGLNEKAIEMYGKGERKLNYEFREICKIKKQELEAIVK